MFEITELQRRMANVIRVGTISEVDTLTAKARVKLTDGLVTGLLPWMTEAGHVSKWRSPSVGEQVILLAPNGSLELAVIIGGLFSRANAPVSSALAETHLSFSDGTVLKYDENSHFLKIEMSQGKVEIKAPEVKIDGKLTVTQPVEFKDTLKVTKTITSGGDQVAGGISQQTHFHGNGNNGADTTPPK